MTSAVERFWELARRNAAVQRKVAAASRHAQPLEAMAAVANEAGLAVTPGDLARSLGGRPSATEPDTRTGLVTGRET